jgi:hypothetical protein
MSSQSSDPFIASWSEIDGLGWRRTRFLETPAIPYPSLKVAGSAEQQFLLKSSRALARGLLLTGADKCPSHKVRQTPDANECFSGSIETV